VSARRGRARAIAVVALVVFGVLLVSGWTATRAVFFLGTDDQGFVTVYQGIPYEVGIRLYSPSYVSGLPLSQLPPAQRRTVTDHSWRSRDDALAAARRLERENRP
jgi:protein phosphatase